MAARDSRRQFLHGMATTGAFVLAAKVLPSSLLAGQEAPPSLEQERSRVDARERVDPPLEKVERHIHGREKEKEEDRHLHERAGLEGPEAHGDPGRPEHRGHVHEEPEQDEAEEVDLTAEHLHAHEQRDHGHD